MLPVDWRLPAWYLKFRAARFSVVRPVNAYSAPAVIAVVIAGGDHRADRTARRAHHRRADRTGHAATDAPGRNVDHRLDDKLL